MAKDKREIYEAVRVSGHGVFVKGQEEELEAVLSSDEVARLTEKGLIGGFEVKKKTEPAKPEAGKKPEAVK